MVGVEHLADRLRQGAVRGAANRMITPTGSSRVLAGGRLLRESARRW